MHQMFHKSQSSPILRSFWSRKFDGPWMASRWPQKATNKEYFEVKIRERKRNRKCLCWRHHVTSFDLWSKPKQGVAVLWKIMLKCSSTWNDGQTRGGEWLRKDDTEQARRNSRRLGENRWWLARMEIPAACSGITKVDHQKPAQTQWRETKPRQAATVQACETFFTEEQKLPNTPRGTKKKTVRLLRKCKPSVRQLRQSDHTTRAQKGVES